MKRVAFTGSVAKNDSGFTLIELLVALAIAVIISAMAWRALDGATQAQERVQAVVDEVDSLDRIWQYMSTDFLFAAPRIWRNTSGQNRSAMMGVFGDRLAQSDAVVADEADYLLQFIRSDRSNLLDVNRSNLSLVGYRLTANEDSELKNLWRDNWSPVDGTGEPKMRQRLLVENVKSLSFRYLPANAKSLDENAWLTGWPSQSQNTVSAISNLPAAVEVTIEVPSLGEIVRLFELTPSS